jgi:septum site-determining protein MinD
LIITIASGKGGVGKSNLVANLGLCLSDFGVDTLIFDGNLSNGDLSCILGPPFPETTIQDVFSDGVNFNDIIFTHPAGVKMIASSLALDDIEAIHPQNLWRVRTQLSRAADIVLVDAPGTLGNNTLEALKIADRVILVTTPEITSFSNTLKTKMVAEKNGVEIFGTVLNKVRKNEKSVRRIAKEWLGTPLLCSLPYDNNVIKSSEYGRAVLRHKPRSPYSVGIRKFGAKLANVTYKASRRKLKRRRS